MKDSTDDGSEEVSKPAATTPAKKVKYTDSEVASKAALATDDDDNDADEIPTVVSEDRKPAEKPSVVKPAAKSTKTKEVTKPEAKKTTRPISTYFVPQAARVSLDGPSISSAMAMTAKKGTGKKRTLLDSDDEYELNCELSSSPDFWRTQATDP